MVLLRTAEDKIMRIPDAYVAQSFLLAEVLSYTKVCEPIPVQVQHRTLELVLQFMMQNDQVVKKSYEIVEIRMTPQAQNFLEGLSNDQLSDLANATNYLNCPVLLELTCRFIADKVQNKTVDEIKSIFGIEGEPNDEEKARFESEFGWMSSTDEE